ncbi:MAG TPA: HEAT repeat domain-containing protein [Gaiellaceae bacterium]|nr:HEAT repeat domain-containing protein [Gaiellaceae bacterium]
MTLAEAAARADALAAEGKERELADLRRQWDDELEGDARAADYRKRAVAYRAVGQFRFRQKMELLRRGLEDQSPACRGSALVSLELLSRDAPGAINSARPLLHRLVSADENQAVRRLAVVCLRNGSPSRDTIVLLNGLAEDDEADRELRDVSRKVAAQLKKKADTR